MCGIFFSLCRGQPVLPLAGTACLLHHRGPDSLGTRQVSLHTGNNDAPSYQATFVSTVLSLRGTTIAEQPLVDEASGSVLCWNGEAWKFQGKPVEGSDSQLVFQALLGACRTNTTKERGLAQRNVVNVLFSISGPYAFVFYDAENQHLYHGRDCLGRRSLLKKDASDQGLILSSVCDNSSAENWSEVEADGIHVIDLLHLPETGPLPSMHIPHCHSCLHTEQLHFVGKYLPSRPMLRLQERTIPRNEHYNTDIRFWRRSKPAGRQSARSGSSQLHVPTNTACQGSIQRGNSIHRK